jgi:hypothetical protein|tara:strand:+ start:96 stop:320 length:225 start_codon:yes stop_codon:yes gene_type:complete
MKPLTKQEIKELERKMNIPRVRKGPQGAVVPPDFTEREEHHIVFVMLEEVRRENGNGGIKKHWNKMSKKERSQK